MEVMFSLMDGGEGRAFIRYARRPNSGLVKIRCAPQRLAGRRGVAHRITEPRPPRPPVTYAPPKLVVHQFFVEERNENNVQEEVFD